MKSKRITLQEVQRAAWDAQWWRDLRSANARLLWFHLLTGPHLDASPAPGLLSVRQVQIADEMGWSDDDTRAALELLETAEQIRVDGDNRLILMRASMLCNLPDNPNMAKSALRSYLQYPACPLRDEAIEIFSDMTQALGGGFKSTVDAFRKEFSETAAEAE
jgi:hypothetical protein